MAIRIDEFHQGDLKDSLLRFQKNSDKYWENLRLISRGMGIDAESDERKMKAAIRREVSAEVRTAENMGDEEMESAAKDPLATLYKEALIGRRNNILSSEFLEIGMRTARAVCKISIGLEVGTGFLVGENIVATNQHVIRDITEAKCAGFEFLADDNTVGTPANSCCYFADTDYFFYSNEQLDLCLVGLAQPEIEPPLDIFGYIPLLPETGKILIGDPVNIIQHPGGQNKRVVVHDSVFALVADGTHEDYYCWYTGDTQKGSSGSPILNSEWEVVALHHSGVPSVDKNGNILDINGKTISTSRMAEDDAKVKWIANEGIRVSRIVAAVQAAGFQDATHSAVRDRLIKLWRARGATRIARAAAFNGMMHKP